MVFVYQTLMASQMAVGANTVRPFRLQSHLRYSHNVRRNNSQHCLLLFIREKSKLSRFDIGLSRAPAPTILKLRQVLSNGRSQVAPTVVLGRLLCRKIASLGAEGVTLVSYANSSFLTPHSSFFSHRIPIPVQQFYNLIIIKSFYSMIVCTLRIGIDSHGTSMAYLLKRILHDSYH